MMKCIESHKVGQEEAFLIEIKRDGKTTCYKAGLSSHGTTTHCPQCSTYSTLEDARDAYEWCKNLVDNQ